MKLVNKKIVVTGGGGFIGSHIVDNLLQKRHVRRNNIFIPRSNKYDLTNKEAAVKALRGADIVFHLAADIGGVGYSNQHPAYQFHKCMLIDLNILEAAKDLKIQKIVVVSSACAYAENAPIPLKERDLFLGRPPLSHDGYGLVKRMLIFTAEAYRREYGLNTVVIVPNNTFGPRDDFDYDNGHVIPTLIRKCLEEKELVIWGDGKATRDFMYVDDFAEGMVLAMEKLDRSDPVNLGSGTSIKIKDLVKLIVRLTNFSGPISYDPSKPKGQPVRSVNINRAKKWLGFRPQRTLESGIKKTIDWYKKKYLTL